MKRDPEIDIHGLEEALGSTFKNKDLLLEAITHRSYLNERPGWHVPHNERLEYLGDAVLELVVSEELFQKFEEYPEGQLTVLRAALVNYQILAQVASKLGVENFLLMSKGERRDKGKAREVILANAFEALVGALYLDRGFDAAKKFINKQVMIHIEDIIKTQRYKDPKSELQEIIQEKLKVTPIYNVIKESGPAHKKHFEVGVYFGKELIATGSGTSKHEAEVSAAKEALSKYQKKK